MEREVRGGCQPSSQGPLTHLSLGPAGELGGPQNRFRAVFHRASESSPRLPTNLGLDLEAVVNLSPILVSEI